MVSQTNEQALEGCIERALVGISREQFIEQGGNNGAGISEAGSFYQAAAGQGYELGWSKDFDQSFAIDTDKFWRFLNETQAEKLAELEKQQPDSWQRLILERLDKRIKKHGILKLLKNGLDVGNTNLTLLFSAPFNDLDSNVTANFEKNIFSVTRQLYYSNANPNLSLDMALFVNGLPVVTIELKNSWTGQTTYHAKKQYCEDRDPKDTLFNFARCMVHFAVDTNDVYMTTRIDGNSTYFFPFNKGNNFGKGNPVNPNGHRAAYLWEEVFSRFSLANLMQHFAKLAGEKDTDPIHKKILFFPRYQQLEVVRQSLAHAGSNGVGHTYLIQHSAGSGKSNSITWLSYQLIELYQQGSESPLFDSVIVVTDRRVLDKQLKNNIKQFSDIKNIVAHADSSAALKTALETGKKIIITTIQKFPHIVEGIDDLSNSKFAVIIDEAHSSQSGSAADKLNQTLGADDDGPDEVQDMILETMRRRKMRNNASYFAFTATPKNATLERFGVKQTDGSFKPFHLYSMKQAIEEGFILDVLANYTTYKSYYQIEKSIEENPLFDTKKAQKKLRAYVEADKETIKVKADIMANHFIEQVVKPKKLKGKAKAMVITRDIKAAIRYYFSIKEALKKANSPIKVVVAFSGDKTVDGVEYTEKSINSFPARTSPDDPKTIEEFFDTDEFRILVVANKFLTGFDQPKLSTMYVDKKLQGVLAVQALSRLNRCNAKQGKRTEDMFVLDFFNETDVIKKSFDPFYTSTSLSQATDVNMLHDIKGELDDVGVYEWAEVEKFNQLYFAGADADTALSPIIQVSAERFNRELELEDDAKVDFKVKAKQFVKVYAQLACIMPFENMVWEKAYWFLKFLIPELIVIDKDRDAIDGLLDSIDLSTYGLERTAIGNTIGLDNSESEVDPQNPNPRGAHGGDDDEDTLDAIIQAFNERWFEGWDATPEEQRVKLLNIARHVMASAGYQEQVVDNPDEQNSRIAAEKLIKDAINKERRKEVTMYKMYAEDPDFKRAFEASILRMLSNSHVAGEIQRELGV
jgi:type I restriction enzyme R subunit